MLSRRSVEKWDFTFPAPAKPGGEAQLIVRDIDCNDLEPHGLGILDRHVTEPGDGKHCEQSDRHRDQPTNGSSDRAGKFGHSTPL